MSEQNQVVVETEGGGATSVDVGQDLDSFRACRLVAKLAQTESQRWQR
jgi:hypothetical protein